MIKKQWVINRQIKLSDKIKKSWKMNFILNLFVVIFMCVSPDPVKVEYYEISFKSSTNFPKEKLNKSNTKVRVNYTESQITLDIIENDLNCDSKTYIIKNDTIIGGWYSIEDYNYRLLFPKLEMKVDDKFFGRGILYHHIPITENRMDDGWTIYKKWDKGLDSYISGNILLKNGKTTLKTKTMIATPARPYTGSSTTIIKKMNWFEIHLFKKKWEDCIK
jgi:hypothetical protein